MRLFFQILLLLATAPFLPSTASSQAAPEVTIDGHDLGQDSIKKRLSWRAGAAAVPQAGWVAPLKKAPKNTVELPQSDGGFFFGLLLQAIFLAVPASVVLQIYALRKLEGSLGHLARVSAFAMGALWIFVILTALAGSNLSPVWVVFLSPLFVLFLGILLLKGRSGRQDDGLLSPPAR